MFNPSLLYRGIAMIQMFKQFFSMLTVLFSAGEKTAKSLDNLATWAEESSGAFADQARLERQKKLSIITADVTQTKKQLKATA